MDYSQYLDLIQSKKFDEALQYKNSQIPTGLYKYYGLNDNTSLNNSKLQYLSDGKIYLSDFNSFNDPFEGKFLIFDSDKLEQKGWKRELIDEYYSYMTKLYKITCLSDTNAQNMPMWAYYANNHQGFCVEYHLLEKQKKYIFPVTYEEERLYANSIITHIINAFETIRRARKDYTDTSSETDFFNQLVFLSMAAKHTSWRHEAEYRILNPFGNDFPALPKKIFIGLNCTDEYRCKLIDIGKSLNGYCEVYQMSIERDSVAFELSKTRIV